MNQKIKFVLFLLLVASFSLAPDSYAGWKDQNTFSHSSYQFTRPNDRWRLDDESDNTKTLSFLRRGRDIVIYIFEQPALNRKFIRRKYRKHIWKKYLEKGISDRFVKKGYQIVHFDIDQTLNKILIQAVGKDRDYFLLSLTFKSDQFKSDFVVAEVTLQNTDYLHFRDDFLKIAQSIRLP